MSRADASNISRDNHFQNHSEPERPPKSWNIEDPKVRTAIEHDRFLPALMQMVTADRLRGLHYNFMFENPKASLRQRPYMQLSVWPRVLYVVPQTVDLCTFGHRVLTYGLVLPHGNLRVPLGTVVAINNVDRAPLLLSLAVSAIYSLSQWSLREQNKERTPEQCIMLCHLNSYRKYCG